MQNEIVVHRPAWSRDELPLVCGIANAGGGVLVVSPNSITRKFRKMQRTFESIPRETQEALGIACYTEPVMNGAVMNLEIIIPAADFPVDYQGKFYLYQDGEVKQATKEEVIEYSQSHMASDTPTDASPEAPNTVSSTASESATDAPSSDDNHEAQSPRKYIKPEPVEGKRATFAEVSIAAANDLALTTTDEYILRIFETNGRATAKQISELLGVSESTVRRSIRRLRELEFIKRIGSDKAGYWKLLF